MSKATARSAKLYRCRAAYESGSAQQDSEHAHIRAMLIKHSPCKITNIALLLSERRMARQSIIVCCCARFLASFPTRADDERLLRSL